MRPQRSNVKSQKAPSNMGGVYVLGRIEVDGRTLLRETWNCGWTSGSISKRILQHNAIGKGIEGKHVLIGYARGTPNDETEMLQAFQYAAMKKISKDTGGSRHGRNGKLQEIFHPDEKMRAWAQWFRRQYYVATTEEEGDNLDQMVNSILWLPFANGKDARFARRGLIGTYGSTPHYTDYREYEDFETDNDYFTSELITKTVYKFYPGGPDLDPASCKTAQHGGLGRDNKYHTGVNAKHWFDIREDGLKREWFGTVFVNPPWGNRQTLSKITRMGLSASKLHHWTEKAAEEYRSGRVKEICFYITSNSCSDKVMQPLLPLVKAICIANPRWQHWGPKVRTAKGNHDGNMILYLGPRTHEFKKCFSHLGIVLTT
jgi:hypothetical protein